jgi:predicted ATP-grasp superfamily ATP-dependent carboligase
LHEDRIMTRILVYEYITAAHEAVHHEDLLHAGAAMRAAMVGDLLDAGAAGQSLSLHCAGLPQTRRLPGAFRNASACAHLPVHWCAPGDGESAEHFLARVAGDFDIVWAVAPESQGVLKRLCHAVDRHRWLGCSEQAIALATNKRATNQVLAAAGIAATQAWDGNQPGLVAGAPTARWVVKPEDGAGAVDTVRFDDLPSALSHFNRRVAAGEACLLEPWVDGDALSLSLLCGRDNGCAGAELLSINRQHISVHEHGQVGFDGVSHHAWPVDSARGRRLAQLGSAVARAIAGLNGFVGVDVVWHAQCGPLVVEVNPRVTCAYVGLSETLGRNLARDMLAVHHATMRAEAAPAA